MGGLLNPLLSRGKMCTLNYFAARCFLAFKAPRAQGLVSFLGI